MHLYNIHIYIPKIPAIQCEYQLYIESIAGSVKANRSINQCTTR